MVSVEWRKEKGYIRQRYQREKKKKNNELMTRARKSLLDQRMLFKRYD